MPTGDIWTTYWKLSLGSSSHFTLAKPFYMSTFGKNCPGQTRNMRFWIIFKVLKLLTIWSKKPLLRSCKQTFAAVCLLQLEFLPWKIFFDMVPRFDQAQLQKMQFQISFHNIYSKYKPRNHEYTKNIFRIFFLSPK